MRPLATLLAGIGLVALALTAPTDGGESISNGAPRFWVDTQTRKYNCSGSDVMLCETTARGSCNVVDICESYCFKDDRGAACVDMGDGIMENSSTSNAPHSKASAPMLHDKIAARDASPQENKHYVCSKDRRSVLICLYGFCSTDYYCKNGDECKDESVSCKSKVLSAQGSKFEVRTVVDGLQSGPLNLQVRNSNPKEKITYVCSKDRASVLKCTYGFCATDYYCAKGHPCIDNPARCKKAITA